MTEKNLAAFETLTAGFREAALIKSLPAEMQEEFEDLAQTASMQAFPGVVLTWPRPGKCSVYYAVADSAAQWRRLRPLLMAFVGPTVTSFDGLPAELLPKIPVEQYLLSDTQYITARIVPGSEQKHRQMARRALERCQAQPKSEPLRAPARKVNVNQLISSSLLARGRPCVAVLADNYLL